MPPHRPVEGRDVGRAREHVDIVAGIAAGAERRVDGRALDVQQVDADPVGEVLHASVHESQAHRKRHADLRLVHARCTTSSSTLPIRSICASRRKRRAHSVQDDASTSRARRMAVARSSGVGEPAWNPFTPSLTVSR